MSWQLIDYGKLGDTNERAMRMADFWLTVSASCLPPKSHPLLPEGEGLLEEEGLGKIKPSTCGQMLWTKLEMCVLS